MAVGGSEHPSFSELVGPEDGLSFPGFFTLGGRENLGVGPDFFDDVQFVHRGFVVGWKVLHHWVVFDSHCDRVLALVFVVAAGHTEKLAPIIDFGRAVGVHRAVDDHGVDTFSMRLGDFANVCLIVGVGKTLVVDDDIKTFGPFWIVVEVDLGFGSFASFEDDGPVDVGSMFFGSQLHGFGLVIVVVATSTGDDEDFEWFGCRRLRAAEPSEAKQGTETPSRMPPTARGASAQRSSMEIDLGSKVKHRERCVGVGGSP
jgi:hypothetical protein